MNEALNQKISQFLDNDLDYDDALDLSQKLQTDADMANPLIRYEAISHAIKTNEFLAIKPDFSAKIAEHIQLEPFYLLSKPKQKPVPAIVRQQKLYALAASVAVVAVFAMNGTNNPAVYSSSMQPAQQVAQQQIKPAIKSAGNAHQLAQSEEQYPLNKRINDYLQAHNNSIYTNGEADLSPLARVTAYRQK